MATMTNKLRVASWNVREGVPLAEEFSRAEVREELTQLLMTYNIDIVALQEVDFDKESRSFILDAIHDQTDLSNHAYNVLSESSFNPEGRAGVAIASRFPLMNINRKNFRNPKLQTNLQGSIMETHDKGWVAASMMVFGLEISALSVHVFPFHLFGRSAQDAVFSQVWSDLSTELGKLAKGPLIACGDFNTPRRDLVFLGGSALLERAVIDQPTHREHAYDDVLFTKDFYLESIDVIGNFSDHKMCCAEFVIGRPLWMSRFLN